MTLRLVATLALLAACACGTSTTVHGVDPSVQAFSPTGTLITLGSDRCSGFAGAPRPTALVYYRPASTGPFTITGSSNIAALGLGEAAVATVVPDADGGTGQVRWATGGTLTLTAVSLSTQIRGDLRATFDDGVLATPLLAGPCLQ